MSEPQPPVPKPSPLLYEASIDEILAELVRRSQVVVVGIETPVATRVFSGGTHSGVIGMVSVFDDIARELKRQMTRPMA